MLTIFQPSMHQFDNRVLNKMFTQLFSELSKQTFEKESRTRKILDMLKILLNSWFKLKFPFKIIIKLLPEGEIKLLHALLAFIALLLKQTTHANIIDDIEVLTWLEGMELKFNKFFLWSKGNNSCRKKERKIKNRNKTENRIETKRIQDSLRN